MLNDLDVICTKYLATFDFLALVFEKEIIKKIEFAHHRNHLRQFEKLCFLDRRVTYVILCENLNKYIERENFT